MRNRRLVAVILDTTRPYQRKMIRGVAAYARDAASWSLYVEEDRLDKLPNLQKWHGHGVILSFVERKDAEAVRDLSIPVVGVEGGYGWYDPASHIPYFATDDNAIGRMAAEHLMGQGFSRLAYCGMPRNRLNVWSEKRARAFKQRASEAGLPCSMYRGHLSVHHWNELQRDLADWLRSLEKPVGIMAANDTRARHLLEVCRTIRAQVPNEVAVIGVDNDELMCKLTEPSLTSIEQGARAVGYRAVKLLDRMMSGKKPSQIANYVVPEGVVCRRSTDYLAIEDPDVAAAVRFIRQHACERISMADLLEVISVSRSTLETRFNKIMGRTVHDEILGVMLSQAQRLIVEGKLALKQVAAATGFSHVQHMTNSFRQQLGQTPGEFQRMARLGVAAGALAPAPHEPSSAPGTNRPLAAAGAARGDCRPVRGPQTGAEPRSNFDTEPASWPFPASIPATKSGPGGPRKPAIFGQNAEIKRQIGPAQKTRLVNSAKKLGRYATAIV